MTAAQVKLVKNVIRMGDTLNLFWKTEEGAKYTLRYEFGSLTGTAAEGIAAGNLDWVFSSDTFSGEMVGYVMDGMVYLDTLDGSGNRIGTTGVDFTVADSYILIPSFSAGFVNVGETVSLSVTSPSWLYSPASTLLKYQCGEVTGNISLNYDGYLPTRWYRDWTVPVSLAKEYPADTTFYVEIPLETEYKNVITDTETVIGRVVYRLEVRVPEIEEAKPEASLTATAESTVDAAFDGYFIRGKTKVRVKVEASSELSEIAAVTIQCGQSLVEASEAVFDLTGDTMTLRATVTDRRGYGRSVSKTITALAYAAPGVAPVSGQTEIICGRATSDGVLSKTGEFLLIRALRRYTSIGNGLNKCVLRYRMKVGGGSYGSWVTLLKESDAGNVWDSIVNGVVLSLKSPYTVQLSVTDTMAETRIYTFPVPGSVVPFHIGKGNRNVTVGGYCDYSREDVFDVHFTSYFFTGAAALAVFEGGSWQAGAELGSAVPEADLTGIGSYNLLIALSGGLPVLLVRAGNIIAGGNIKIQYTEDGGAEALTLESAEAPITALYKLL